MGMKRVMNYKKASILFSTAAIATAGFINGQYDPAQGKGTLYIGSQLAFADSGPDDNTDDICTGDTKDGVQRIYMPPPVVATVAPGSVADKKKSQRDELFDFQSGYGSVVLAFNEAQICPVGCAVVGKRPRFEH